MNDVTNFVLLMGIEIFFVMYIEFAQRIFIGNDSVSNIYSSSIIYFFFANMYLFCILIFFISDVAMKDSSTHVKVILPIVLTLVGILITIVLSLILVFVIHKVRMWRRYVWRERLHGREEGLNAHGHEPDRTR